MHMLEEVHLLDMRVCSSCNYRFALDLDLKLLLATFPGHKNTSQDMKFGFLCLSGALILCTPRFPRICIAA